MPDRAYLHPIDPELLPGARNAIDTCLRLKPEERITIITDTVTRGIAAALQSEVERLDRNTVCLSSSITRAGHSHRCLRSFSTTSHCRKCRFSPRRPNPVNSARALR